MDGVKRGRSALMSALAMVVMSSAFAAVSSGSRVEAAVTPDVDGLTVTTVLSDLPGNPVAARFAPDGRIYVAIKDGRVLMYDGPGDTTPVTTLDIRSQVMSYGDRGLLGLALDPAFGSGRPYMYILYTYDRDPFGTAAAPRWNDVCPTPPGANTDGCTVTARADRYTVDGNGVVTGQPLRLLDGSATTSGGWCNQFSSHSIGTLRFGADGMLYVGAGDGGSYDYADYGQSGGSLAGTPTPADPCNDTQNTTPRSGGRGTALTAATSKGGAVRAQSVRAAQDGDYVTWDGAILRVDPNTGLAAAGNPLIGNGIGGDDRIVAYGMRNPFRFSFQPGTNRLWLGDVGWSTYEEVDRFDAGPTQTSVPNFGWPCYEGPRSVGAYDALNIGLCESLYANGTSSLGGVSSPLTSPLYSWTRLGKTGALPCGAGASGGGGAVTGGSFVTNPNWPTALRGAYVFGDYARQCIAYMPINSAGEPDTTQVHSIISGAFPVDIETGPDGDIYWMDIADKTFDHIRPVVGNLPPVAAFTATPSSGSLPLAVQFDASPTTDPNPGDVLTYTWDLDGDGACDDANGVTASRTYTTVATIAVKLCVTDALGATNTATRQIRAGNLAPVITRLTTSADASGWKVGDTVTFSAAATDDGAALPQSAYTWSLVIRHCESETGPVCHTHPLSIPAPGTSGSFATPDHEYYAFLQLSLTVTDASGLATTRTVDIRPRVSTVSLQTSPPGIAVSLGEDGGLSPLTSSFLENGAVQLVAPTTAAVGGSTYTFAGWADSGSVPATRTVGAVAGSSTYTALYTVTAGPVSGDTTPPVITSATAGPAQLDPRSNGDVSVSASVTDDHAIGSVVATIVGQDGITHSAVLARDGGSGWAGTVVLPADTRPGAYAVTITATDGSGNSAAASAGSVEVVWADVGTPPPPTSPTSASGFRMITPTRLLDTRDGTGVPAAGAVQGGSAVRLQIAGTPGIPAAATGVSVDVTAVDSQAAGYVTVSPCGSDAPVVSNLNMQAGQTVANLAVVDLDDTGAICLFASQPTDLVVDATAYVAAGGDGYRGISPVRVVDTRDGTGLVGATITPGQVVELPLAAASVPGGASGVVANVTVTEPDAAGYLTVFPCASGAPLASNVNFAGGQTVSNLVLVGLDPSRHVCATTNATLHLVVDVSGWVVPGGGSPDLVTPHRVLDTRVANGRLTTGQTIQISAADLGVPGSATAVIANVTAVDTAAAGYVTVAPCEAGVPLVSNVNFSADDTRPVLTMTTLGPSRTICVHASQPLDLVVDVQGWFG